MERTGHLLSGLIAFCIPFSREDVWIYEKIGMVFAYIYYAHRYCHLGDFSGRKFKGCHDLSRYYINCVLYWHDTIRKECCSEDKRIRVSVYRIYLACTDFCIVLASGC